MDEPGLHTLDTGHANKGIYDGVQISQRGSICIRIDRNQFWQTIRMAYKYQTEKTRSRIAGPKD